MYIAQIIYVFEPADEIREVSAVICVPPKKAAG
jgi:hypothetical protein